MSKMVYEVHVQITTAVTVPVKAESLEEAIKKASDFAPEQLYRIKRPANGIAWDETEVVGVYK